MTDNVQALLEQGLAQLAATCDPHELENVKAQYVGKQGAITALLKQPRRATAGRKENLWRNRQPGQASVRGRTEYLSRFWPQTSSPLSSPLKRSDITLPGRGSAQGGLHPVTLVQQRIESAVLVARL